MTDASKWFNDDSYWDALGPVFFSPGRLEKADTEVAQIIELLSLPEGSAVLDLCCGVGRHTIAFARSGYRVTAVDRTPAYLQEAERKVQAANLAVDFVQADMRDFCRPGSMDAAINLFTSFGYFAHPDDDRKVIENIYKTLKPGGKVVLEMMGKEILAGNFRERDWSEDNGIMVLEERKVRDDWGSIESRWIVIKDSKKYERTISLRLYSGKELSHLLTSCGFSEVNVYGNLAGSNYDHAAERLVVLGHK